MKRHCLRGALALALVVLGTAAARSDDVDQRIYDVLREPTIIDFTLVPLDDGVKYLSDYHGIPINLDSEVLQKAGIKPNDVATTLKTKDTPLGLALRAMLEPNKLSFMIKGHVLTVTTLKEAKPWQTKHAELFK